MIAHRPRRDGLSRRTEITIGTLEGRIDRRSVQPELQDRLQVVQHIAEQIQAGGGTLGAQQPVGIGGSERVMPKKAKFVYPRKVHVEIGPPILPPKAAPGQRLAREAYREHSQLLHDELQRLFDEAMSHVPWDYPATSQSQ